jgi:hypothetical protein
MGAFLKLAYAASRLSHTCAYGAFNVGFCWHVGFWLWPDEWDAVQCLHSLHKYFAKGPSKKMLREHSHTFHVCTSRVHFVCALCVCTLRALQRALWEHSHSLHACSSRVRRAVPPPLCTPAAEIEWLRCFVPLFSGEPTAWRVPYWFCRVQVQPLRTAWKENLICCVKVALYWINNVLINNVKVENRNERTNHSTKFLGRGGGGSLCLPSRTSHSREWQCIPPCIGSAEGGPRGKRIHLWADGQKLGALQDSVHKGRRCVADLTMRDIKNTLGFCGTFAEST